MRARVFSKIRLRNIKFIKGTHWQSHGLARSPVYPFALYFGARRVHGVPIFQSSLDRFTTVMCLSSRPQRVILIYRSVHLQNYHFNSLHVPLLKFLAKKSQCLVGLFNNCTNM